jgi:hypothetical protein
MLQDWEDFLEKYELTGLAKRVEKTAKVVGLRGKN